MRTVPRVAHWMQQAPCLGAASGPSQPAATAFWHQCAGQTQHLWFTSVCYRLARACPDPVEGQGGHEIAQARRACKGCADTLQVAARACTRRRDSPVENPHADPQQGAQAQAEDGAAAWWARPSEAWGCGERLLAAGAAAVADLRAAVFSELGFTTSAGAPCFLSSTVCGLRLASHEPLRAKLVSCFCHVATRHSCKSMQPPCSALCWFKCRGWGATAGVAHNKILAKLGSGLHKPAQQTVVPLTAVAALLAPLPVGRLRQLGGKFGEQLTRDLGIATVGAPAGFRCHTTACHGWQGWGGLPAARIGEQLTRDLGIATVGAPHHQKTLISRYTTA